MKMTKETIMRAVENGTITFEVDPNMGAGTVARIGDYWFYFGGSAAEEESPEEYLARVPKEDVAEEIFDALSDFENENPDEIAYYDAVVLESFGKTEILERSSASGGAERIKVLFEGRTVDAAVLRKEDGSAEVFMKVGSEDAAFEADVLQAIETLKPLPRTVAFRYRNGRPVKENDRLSVRIRIGDEERFEVGTLRFSVFGIPYLELDDGSKSNILETADRCGICFEIQPE